MARYRFHAVNDSEFVFDAVGKDIRMPDRVTVWARRVAQDATRGEDGDGSDWSVSVHDLSGRRILVQPFVGEDGTHDGIPHPERYSHISREAQVPLLPGYGIHTSAFLEADRVPLPSGPRACPRSVELAGRG
ncbi:MAG: hypothetical protein Q7T93_07210 [Methylobacterium sp.]|uniref:DUF6894 family protein n=1 Tax=Methylobacterium sp. TaxID=409 RepID=UPI00271BF46E|nr:hypothetical protein [Methylobacterium sp.]MDO9426605.1 hypothetical protein [Methylobacterium sp.]